MKWNDPREMQTLGQFKLSGYAPGRMKLPFYGTGRSEEKVEV